MRRVALAIVLLLSACASGQPSGNVTEGASPLSTPTKSDGQPARELGRRGEALEPGRYTRAGFEPRVTFEISENGWTPQQVAAGFFDIQHDPGSLDVVAVQFGSVVGPSTAAEAIAAVRGRDRLTVSASEEVAIGGVEGRRVIVETKDPPTTEPPIFRQVLALKSGPISIGSARRLQVTLVDTPRGVLAVMVGGSIKEWDRTLRLAMPVIESVTIGG
jgi:hypothetical protein